MSIIDAIKARSSNGIMTDTAVSLAHIKQLLDAAVCTPVHHNAKPWRFLVIQGAGRQTLSDIMVQHLDKRISDPKEPRNIALRQKLSQKAFRSPVIIAVAAAKPDGEKILMIENVASAVAACQNILLAAPELGLSAFWRTGSFMYAPDTVSALGFEGGAELVGLIYLGYPKREMRPKPRETSDPYVRWLE
ncbi:MAG: nitroreductase [Emcibacter sp.]|nr:nitroreductase [Emcibacter sp.]